jgi:hypothetical protein
MKGKNSRENADMDAVTAATQVTALLSPLLPAILDGGAKEVGKTAVAAAFEQGKKVWALLSSAPNSGPLIAAGQNAANSPGLLADSALNNHIIALLASNTELLEQVANALADENSSQARNIEIHQGKKSIAITGKSKARDINFGKIVKKKP